MDLVYLRKESPITWVKSKHITPVLASLPKHGECIPPPKSKLSPSLTFPISRKSFVPLKLFPYSSKNVPLMKMFPGQFPPCLRHCSPTQNIVLTFATHSHQLHKPYQCQHPLDLWSILESSPHAQISPLSLDRSRELALWRSHWCFWTLAMNLSIYLPSRMLLISTMSLNLLSLSFLNYKVKEQITDCTVP